MRLGQGGRAKTRAELKGKLMELNSREVQALNTILDSALVDSKDDDGDPVFHEMDVDGVNPFADKSTLDDVYTSLSEKGLIQCSGTEDDNGAEILEYVCITPEGLEALKSAKGVN